MGDDGRVYLEAATIEIKQVRNGPWDFKQNDDASIIDSFDSQHQKQLRLIELKRAFAVRNVSSYDLKHPLCVSWIDGKGPRKRPPGFVEFYLKALDKEKSLSVKKRKNAHK